MPFQIALLYDKMLKGMPLNIISYKKAIWKGIEGHLKGIVQKLEDSQNVEHWQIGQIVKDWSSKRERRVVWHFGSLHSPSLHFSIF